MTKPNCNCSFCTRFDLQAREAAARLDALAETLNEAIVDVKNYIAFFDHIMMEEKK